MTTFRIMDFEIRIRLLDELISKLEANLVILNDTLDSLKTSLIGDINLISSQKTDTTATLVEPLNGILESLNAEANKLRTTIQDLKNYKDSLILQKNKPPTIQ